LVRDVEVVISTTFPNACNIFISQYGLLLGKGWL